MFSSVKHTHKKRTNVEIYDRVLLNHERTTVKSTDMDCVHVSVQCHKEPKLPVKDKRILKHSNCNLPVIQILLFSNESVIPIFFLSIIRIDIGYRKSLSDPNEHSLYLFYLCLFSNLNDSPLPVVRHHVADGHHQSIIFYLLVFRLPAKAGLVGRI